MVQPAVCVISNISIEHSSYLGNTISEIAGEKGGIIKKGTPVVTGARQKQAIQVLKRIAAERNAPIYRLGKQFRVRRDRKGTFTYYGINTKWSNMHTGLLGNHQVDNTALVLAACEIIQAEKAGRISLESIRQGIDENRWPGRLEVVSESPYVIIDGAHNLVAAKNLSDFLSSNINNRHLTLVIGVLDDKPYEAMLKSLLPVCSKVILTRPKIERSLDPEKLYPIAKKMVKDVKIIPDVAKAVSHAVKTSSSDDAVCIAGSLYVVGEAKEKLDLSALVKYHHN
jgi:dihydrofolate synthase/folylpolyglutamate synthase